MGERLLLQRHYDAQNRDKRMIKALKTLCNENNDDFKGRLLNMGIVLGVINIGAWVWAFIAFWDKPGLLGIALLIYGLGLRHAIDADHIAAIDNVTRKLMQAEKRPVSVGFFFAMGHSTVVIIAAAFVAFAASLLNNMESASAVTGTISTLVSSAFLLIIAAMNIAIFVSIYRNYKRIRAGGKYIDEDMDILLNNRGFLSRIFKPLFKFISKSWHMYPLGFLFGLGFDTSTEVAMFGISAAQMANGIPFESMMIFPVLFAAGMSLVDTIDGVMMLGAYNWAFVKPIRKLYYNMSITGVSIIVALFIGGLEALGLIGDQLNLDGGFWNVMGMLNDNLNDLGFCIIGLFILAWGLSYMIYKIKGLDDIEIKPANP